tara:strand:+ start:89 stop:460 length:372 start_codon:yes stop_codon:yes gene_type:complete
MRVKITRTIDLADLAREIRRMVAQAGVNLSNDLPEQFTDIVRTTSSNDGAEFFSSIENIDEFRKSLSAYDETLQELQNILTGYKNAMMPPPPEQDQEWIDQDQAEYEKHSARQLDAEEEYEEG